MTGVTNPSGLTVSTEQSTWRSTFSAVLPMNRPATPERHTVPMTMTSICLFLAKCGMISLAAPFTM